MKECARCGAPMASGGMWDGPLRYCGAECLRLGPAERFIVPRAHLEGVVWEIHQGPCPHCGGPGPVDLHASWHVWSAVVLTRWMRDARLSCEPCGRAARWRAAGKSFLLGWWGFPVGLVMTPVQIGRNVAGNFTSVDASRPSRALVDFVHARLHRDLVAAEVDEYEPGGNR